MQYGAYCALITPILPPQPREITQPAADADATTTTDSTDDAATSQLRDMFQQISDLGWGQSSNPDRKKIYDEVDDLLKTIDSTDKELQENYDKAKANEQSLANRTLGAAAIGSMGIGAMQAMSGKAEQSEDAEAEANMKAYIQTFRCDYGQGRNIQGGDKGIEVPGANALLNLRQQYMTLAQSLKDSKESLEMAPGIESEVILSASDTGLYDNAALGNTGGKYTSIYRALTDENSADAKAWQEQKDASAKKVKTGLTVAGIGAAVGVVGNIATSVAGGKENSADIMRRRNEATSKLRDIISCEIKSCNEKIADAKELAQSIKDNKMLMDNTDLQNFVSDITQLKSLPDDSSITAIKEHPLCR